MMNIKKEQNITDGEIVFSNAKINIGLKIRNKRDDGYHNIETVMYPIPLFDVIEWRVSEKFSIDVYGTEADLKDKTGKNLIEKAYDLLKLKFDIPPIKIKLLKNIPVGSGLGGGSSNAVFFTKSINSVFGLGMNSDEIEKLTLEIGSDCPFFVNNEPAYVSGRGENIINTKCFLSGYQIFIVFPHININTSDLYGKVSEYGSFLNYKKLINSNPDQWKKFVNNDFETILFKDYPVLEEIKNKLYKSGALYCSVTGSGSAVYGIFDSQKQINENLFSAGYFTFKSKL